MATKLQMDITLNGVLVGAVARDERTNPTTGEKYAADGKLYLLDRDEYGVPSIQEIKCSPGMARLYSDRVIEPGEQASAIDLPVNFKQWTMPVAGKPDREGTTLRLIESRPAVKQAA